MSAPSSGHRSGRPRRRGAFRKRLLGYHPHDVDGAIAARDEAIAARDDALREAGERVVAAEAQAGAERAELEARRAEAGWATRRIQELGCVSARLATLVVDRDRELRQIREELQASLARDDHGMRTLAALADDLQTVRRQARAQATRIRLRALREAAAVAERIADVERDGDEARERLIRRLEAAIERVGAEDDDEEVNPAIHSEANGQGEREPGELFDGLVEVEVGPLSDFSQLVGLEDAAGAIGATSEISVKRFTQGRATLAMRFKHPVELLRELEERAPFEFKVRDTRSGRVVLDLDE